MKVLIIEDDELVRLTCRNLLKKEGHEVLEAENGAAGVDCFKKEKPDLVITDILMPDKEGLETIIEIRAINPDAKILAISSGGSTQNMSFLKMAKELGATYALKKPLKPDQLVAVTREMIKK